MPQLVVEDRQLAGGRAAGTCSGWTPLVGRRVSTPNVAALSSLRVSWSGSPING